MNQKLPRLGRAHGVSLARSILVVAVFVAIGFGVLHIAHAATYAIPSEAEDGQITGNAKAASHTGASGGQAVLFGPATGAGGSGSGGSQPPSLNLFDPSKKEIAMELVSSAENSTLDWQTQYGYIEDIGDGRGYTGGIIGFTSGTDDMLKLVQHYNNLEPNNILTKYIPALKRVDGSASHQGLGSAFVSDWKAAAQDPKFQEAQNNLRDSMYFDPAVNRAIGDGLRALGQFIYYDAMVMHGPGNDPDSFGGIRAAALRRAKTPAQGGNEVTYLNAFLDVRKAAMLREAAHQDTSRIDDEQRVFLQNGNMNLNVPLNWQTYGDRYTITKNP